MQNRRVVITGMGAVTPLGNSVEATWDAAKAGKCGIGLIQSFDTSQQKVKVAGEVDINPTDHVSPAEARRLERFVFLALVAGKEALAQSGITPENTDMDRSGVLVSSGIGAINAIVREQMKGLEKGFDRISPFFIPMSIINMAGGRLAIESGFRGYCSSVVTACASGTNAVGDAMRAIRHGYADVMLCGGTEASIGSLAVGGFTSMKALYEGDDPNRATIPFDKERSGFVMGEGAGILVLEELEHAKKRGATILGEVTGYGVTCDAYHITAPEPTGTQAARAMHEAILDAGLKPEDIGYINAHGTSTPLNDKTETMAVKTALGDAAKTVKMSSTKSMTGHLLGAAGAVEAIFCAKSIEESFIPATIHYQVADEDCDLDIVPNVGQTLSYQHAMTNSLGFGGHNASLIISKFGG